MQLDAMLEILRQEAQSYQELLQLSRDKNKAIISNDVDTITEIGKSESQLLMRLERTENNRVREIDALARELSLPEEEITLTYLRQHATPREKIQITALQKALGKIVEELAGLNESNKMLIDTQLSYIGFYLDVATQEGVTTNNYSSNGEMDQKKRTSLGLFDQEA